MRAGSTQEDWECVRLFDQITRVQVAPLLPADWVTLDKVSFWLHVPRPPFLVADLLQFED